MGHLCDSVAAVIPFPMRQIVSITAFVAILSVASPVMARLPVTTQGCGPSISAEVIEDILSLETTDSDSIDRIEITCDGVTRIEVFTQEQSLTRRITTEQMPANGVERFLALNAAEMLELFARQARTEPPSEPDPIDEGVVEDAVIEPESDFDTLRLHIAGLARVDLGAPAPAGGFAIEAEFAPTQFFRLAVDFQTATSSTDVSGEVADQLFLAGALKGGYAASGARFMGLLRVGGVQLSREASGSRGWAFWGGPALSAGYRLPLFGFVWLDGSTEVGYSPWTWGGRFDGQDEFRTEHLWFSAQLGLTGAF